MVPSTHTLKNWYILRDRDYILICWSYFHLSIPSQYYKNLNKLKILTLVNGSTDCADFVVVFTIRTRCVWRIVLENTPGKSEFLYGNLSKKVHFYCFIGTLHMCETWAYFCLSCWVFIAQLLNQYWWKEKKKIEFQKRTSASFYSNSTRAKPRAQLVFSKSNTLNFNFITQPDLYKLIVKEKAIRFNNECRFNLKEPPNCWGNDVTSVDHASTILFCLPVLCQRINFELLPLCVFDICCRSTFMQAASYWVPRSGSRTPSPLKALWSHYTYSGIRGWLCTPATLVPSLSLSPWVLVRHWQKSRHVEAVSLWLARSRKDAVEESVSVTWRLLGIDRQEGVLVNFNATLLERTFPLPFPLGSGMNLRRCHHLPPA